MRTSRLRSTVFVLVTAGLSIASGCGSGAPTSSDGAGNGVTSGDAGTNGDAATSADGATLAVDAGAADGSSAIFDYPRGCYTSANAASPIPAAILDNPGLVGVAVTSDWASLESAGDNQFDWSGFDARIAEAKAKGKKIVLGITASAAKAPAWLYANPAVGQMQIADPNPAHGNGMITVAFFWDPIFHAQKLELIAAAGARYGADPDIIGVMEGFANYYTNDWAMPVDMKSHGYTYDGMIQVGKDVLTTAATAFPNQAIKLPLGQNDASMDPGKTTTQMADDMVAFALASPFGNRFFAQKNLINTASLYATDPTLDTIDPSSNSYLLKVLRDMTPHAGLQMVSAAVDGPTDGCRQNAHVSPCTDITGVLQKSIDISLSYKPTFLEFWTGDAASSALYSEMVAATAAMQSF